jgi:transcriptional regulator with XRE-family HTH domain
MDFDQLGAALKRCRMLQDMTATELAEKAGIHRNTLSGYEGGRQPDEVTFVKLCLFLGADVGEVFAAACLAKLQFELRPIEDRQRAELGLPERETRQHKPATEMHDELLNEFVAFYKKLEQFRFEHLGPHPNLEMLVRLRPESLRNLDSEEPKRKRARKKRRTNPKTRRGRPPRKEGEGS